MRRNTRFVHNAARCALPMVLGCATLMGCGGTGDDHVSSAASAAAIDDSLTGCRTNVLGANDDGSTGVTPIGQTLNFFGANYSSLWVNNNGNVTFTGAMSTYTPFNIVTTRRPIIAPFFADVDTRGAGSALVTYGQTTFAGRPTFCVNWAGVGVGYYAARVDKLNRFQLLLVDRADTGNPGNFDIYFNYDQIQWETGDASGGRNGLGGASARAGYSNGIDAAGSYELPGSAVNGAFLDSNTVTGLIRNSYNSDVPGRYVFPVRNGRIARCGDGTVDPNEQCDDGNSRSGDGCSSLCVVENRPPVAVCQNVTVAADGTCGALANVNDNSTDPDGDALTFSQSPAGPYTLGGNAVTLTVTDSRGASSTCTATVTVVDTTAPTLSCPTIPAAECTAPAAHYELPAASAADNCSVASVSPPSTGPYTLGTHAITYGATDGSGNAGSCTTSFVVQDTTPPSVTVGPTINVWPPNHEYRDFSITDCISAVSDTCGGALDVAASGTIVSMSSDEPEDARGGGDGATTQDLVRVDATHFRVRAERKGGGNGRVYRIQVAVRDASGNTSQATCRVAVPHDQSGRAAVDDGTADGYSIP